MSALKLLNLNYLVKRFLVCLFVLFSWSLVALGQVSQTIDKIEIKGNKKIEKEAILLKITHKKGMVLDRNLLREDIKSIYRMKYFDKVEVHLDGVSGKKTLRFVVKERPIIKEVKFEGNNELARDDLLEKIKTKEYSILDINTLKEDVSALLKFYEEKGFYLASINYKVKKITAENVEVVFKIKEFDKVRVKKITILGNRAFTDRELKGIMETREESLFSFMSGSGNFKEFNFEIDIERIKYFYKTKGYLQVNVGKPYVTVSEDRRWLFISFKVIEGPKYYVNKTYYEGELLFTSSEFKDRTMMREGDIYSEEVLRRDIQNLTEMYQDKGYAFANVIRNLEIVPGEHKVDIHFSFEKGKMAYFGKIKVKGNTKTRDKVIRRELKIREGTKYSGSDMRISKSNVERLGFFEPGSVLFNTVTNKDKDDVLDLEIVVKERSTGQIQVGAGYSTASKLFARASLSQNNFRGMGQQLSLSIDASKSTQKYQVDFLDPRAFDSKWAAGGGLFYQKDDTDSRSYNVKRKGFDLRTGYPIYDYTQLSVTYHFKDTEINDKQIILIDSDGSAYVEPRDPNLDVNDENGKSSSVETAVSYDKRNNRMEPTDGYFFLLGGEYSGLGGRHFWGRTRFDARYYNNIAWDFVLRFQLLGEKMFTVGEHPIPLNERLKLGGYRKMRAYALEGIGPQVTRENSNGKIRRFPTGGTYLGYSTVEVQHPLVREAGLHWVVFYEAGKVGGLDFNKEVDRTRLEKSGVRMDWGFGIRWFSPLGLLRFEFAYPINKRNYDSDNEFIFDIGQVF